MERIAEPSPYCYEQAIYDGAGEFAGGDKEIRWSKNEFTKWPSGIGDTTTVVKDQDDKKGGNQIKQQMFIQKSNVRVRLTLLVLHLPVLLLHSYGAYVHHQSTGDFDYILGSAAPCTKRSEMDDGTPIQQAQQALDILFVCHHSNRFLRRKPSDLHALLNGSELPRMAVAAKVQVPAL